jgi:uncharacterized protein YukE
MHVDPPTAPTPVEIGGDPELLRIARGSFAAAATAMHDSAEQTVSLAAGTVGETWTGEAASSFQTAGGAIRNDTLATALAFEQAAAALGRLADELEEAQRQARQAAATAADVDARAGRLRQPATAGQPTDPQLDHQVAALGAEARVAWQIAGGAEQRAAAARQRAVAEFDGVVRMLPVGGRSATDAANREVRILVNLAGQALVAALRPEQAAVPVQTSTETWTLSGGASIFTGENALRSEVQRMPDGTFVVKITERIQGGAELAGPLRGKLGLGKKRLQAPEGSVGADLYQEATTEKTFTSRAEADRYRGAEMLKRGGFLGGLTLAEPAVLQPLWGPLVGMGEYKLWRKHIRDLGEQQGVRVSVKTGEVWSAAAGGGMGVADLDGSVQKGWHLEEAADGTTKPTSTVELGAEAIANLPPRVKARLPGPLRALSGGGEVKATLEVQRDASGDPTAVSLKASGFVTEQVAADPALADIVKQAKLNADGKAGLMLELDVAAPLEDEAARQAADRLGDPFDVVPSLDSPIEVLGDRLAEADAKTVRVYAVDDGNLGLEAGGKAGIVGLEGKASHETSEKTLLGSFAL